MGPCSISCVFMHFVKITKASAFRKKKNSTLGHSNVHMYSSLNYNNGQDQERLHLYNIPSGFS
jgi:hypothetical protein